ncbi:MAG: AAA family ATPase [Methanobrevibacter sp.]|nr:AAA family ATPase [Methanosphaera sp.]MBR0371071.1 AAA family ATPase [Methanobrevibacter sp.]
MTTTTKNNNSISIPVQDKSKRPEITLIYGNPGSGKTTGAWKHCQMLGYNPICIDVNNTNHTPMPNLDIDFSKNHVYLLRELQRYIELLSKSEYDTIVIEDTGRLFDNKLTPVKVNEKNKFAKWEVRATALALIVDCLIKSKMNIIFIGQSDMIIKDHPNKDDNETYSRPVVEINSIVNWAYYTYKPDEITYKWTCTKYREKPGVLYK